jgi:ubiquitin-conjugating enzyme E2 variant
MHTLIQIATVLAEILAVAALADFLAGVIHWIEDAYFDEDTPVIGPLFIRPNIVHHHLPRYFTKLSWWESSKDLFVAGLVVLAGAWWADLLTWQVWLFVILSVNANQIHKWSHRTRAENGKIISWLQDWKILQTPRHHGLHHTDPKNTFYCPITNFVNPVLEKISFWTRLEAVIERVTGIGHRTDTAVRGQGPGPEWLAEFRPAPRKLAPVLSMPARAAHANCGRDCAMCGAKCSGHFMLEHLQNAA